jgi:hypothetical protein
MSVERINTFDNNKFDYLKKFRIKNTSFDSNISVFNAKNTITKDKINNKNLDINNINNVSITVNNVDNLNLNLSDSTEEFIFNRDFNTIPIGTIILYPNKKLPPGFLRCNGRRYTISLYSELFAIVGNKDDKDDKHFRIPNISSPNNNYIYIIKY